MIAHVLLAAVVGVTLLTAAGFELADRTATALAAGTFGLSGRPARWIWLPLAALEATLAAGVLFGPPQAALVAAAGLGLFMLAQAAAIAAGRSGAPCGCFGARGVGALEVASEGPPLGAHLALGAGNERGRNRHGEGYPGGRPPALPKRSAEGVSATLWTTALAPAVAYVTRIRRTEKGTTTVILSLPRT